jgi:pyruvate dehydrogenase E2 component (dihydrolipoamide acetyltransferase)
MPIPIILPKFDPGHTRSEILQWLVGEGESVRAGDPLCEVETDKVNMEVEAPQDGTLAGIRYPVGSVAPATEVIAYLLLPGESTADLPGAPASAVAAAPAPSGSTAPPVDERKVAASPVAQRVAREKNLDLTGLTGSGVGGRIMRRDVEQQSSAPAGKTRATPAAKRLARAHGVDLAALAGSGPRGRVQAADVEAAAAAAIVPVEMPAPMPTPAVDAGQRTEKGQQTEKLSGMRKRIAERLQFSYQTAPHIYVEMPVDATALLTLRRDIEADGDALSMTALLVKACAWTLQRHPRLNATIDGEMITLWESVNIGVAVALDAGLIVPVIHQAESLGLGAVQARSADLIERARRGSLSPGEVTNGTFTISNLGMFGVSRFTAIINPPQVAILAVGRIDKIFVPDAHDQPVLRPQMTLTLAVDHRVVDGADAARFLVDLRKVLEQPVRLVW